MPVVIGLSLCFNKEYNGTEELVFKFLLAAVVSSTVVKETALLSREGGDADRLIIVRLNRCSWSSKIWWYLSLVLLGKANVE